MLSWHRRDREAKAVAAGPARDAGFDPGDLGGVTDGADQQPRGSAYCGEEFHPPDVPGLPRL